MAPAVDHRGGWELSAHPLWKFSLANVIKKPVVCLTLRFLTHQQKDLFFHPNAIHLFGQSLLLLCVFLPLLNLHCVSFDIESTNGAGLLLICPFSCKIDFLCTYGCYSVWMCVFPHSNISEIVGFIESLMKQRGLWCCNVNSV